MYGLGDVSSSIDLLKLTNSIKLHEGTGPRHEGLFFPYTDTTGNITIGYGTNLSAGLTQDEVYALLSNRILTAIRAAETQSWWSYVENDDVRARVFVELIYNMGANGVAGFHAALAAMATGDWDTCADEFLDSLWAKEVKQRAKVLTEMIRTGKDA